MKSARAENLQLNMFLAGHARNKAYIRPERVGRSERSTLCK